VVSRLAREGTPQAAPNVSDPQGDTVTSTAPPASPGGKHSSAEEHSVAEPEPALAPVLPLGRPTASPRHRRAEELLGLAL
jgi:hypothetical protein